MKLPILLITFIRLDTTLQVLKAIREYQPKKLYISSDYGREGRIVQDKQISEKEWVDQIRTTLLEQIDWECEIKTLFFSENQGCKNGVSSAISWFFEHEEMGIILEDDTLPNQSFFYFCEEMLERYKNNQNIFMVSGWSALDFDLEAKNSLKEDYYFSKYNHIWGWASWRRAWSLYQKEFIDFEKEFAQLEFDSAEEKKTWYRTFKSYSKGKINTWDYPWTYTIWKYKGLSVYPKNNMIKNIGFNHSHATNTKQWSKYDCMQTNRVNFPIKHPNKIKRNILLDKKNFLITTKQSPYWLIVVNKLYRILFKKNLTAFKQYMR